MKQPLLGRKVLVTRAQTQASELSNAIKELGGQPIEYPVISFKQPSAPDTLHQLDTAIHELPKYDWIFFTSVNGVEFFIRRLHQLKVDLRTVSGARIAAVGPKTAEVLQSYGLIPEILPNEYVSEGLVSALKPYIQEGQRALLPTADIARTIIAGQLRELGLNVTQVTVYENVPSSENGQVIIDLLRNKEIDILTFTSSSTVRNLFAALRSYGVDQPLELLQHIDVACIGNKTADTASELGLHISVTAHEYTIPGLVQSLIELVKE